MSRYVYDKNQKKVVPIEERTDSPVVDRGKMCWDTPRIVMDIEPYKAVGIPGQPIVNSRSEHREVLKRHGMVEVGNEMSPRMKERKYRDAQ